MTTLNAILAWSGWIWLAISGTYLFMKLRAKTNEDPRRGFDMVTEARQSNE